MSTYSLKPKFAWARHLSLNVPEAVAAAVAFVASPPKSHWSVRESWMAYSRSAPFGFGSDQLRSTWLERRSACRR